MDFSKPEIFNYYSNSKTSAFSVGEIFREDEGFEGVKMGKTELSVLPGAKFGFSPTLDPNNRMTLINKSYLSQRGTSFEELASEISYLDETHGVIKGGTLDSTDPFWAHFKYEIPHISRDKGGFELVVDSPEKMLFVATSLADKGFYYKGLEERPPNLKRALFIVEMKGGKSTIGSGGWTSDVADLMRGLVKASLEKKMRICHMLGIEVKGFENNDEALENMIMDAVTRDPERLVFGEERAANVVKFLVDQEDSYVILSVMVDSSRNEGIFDRREDGGLYLKGVRVGVTYKDATTFLANKNNRGLLTYFVEMVRERDKQKEMA